MSKDEQKIVTFGNDDCRIIHSDMSFPDFKIFEKICPTRGANLIVSPVKSKQETICEHHGHTADPGKREGVFPAHQTVFILRKNSCGEPLFPVAGGESDERKGFIRKERGVRPGMEKCTGMQLLPLPVVPFRHIGKYCVEFKYENSVYNINTILYDCP